MGKLITSMVSIIGALWLGIAGAAGMYWWDRRPADTPGWMHVHFLGHTWWAPPESLQAVSDQRAADFQTERASVLVLRKAFDVENASILSMHSSAVRWQAISRKAGAEAEQATQWRLDFANRIMRTPSPADGSELGLCRAAEGVLKETGQ